MSKKKAPTLKTIPADSEVIPTEVVDDILMFILDMLREFELEDAYVVKIYRGGSKNDSKEGTLINKDFYLRLLDLYRRLSSTTMRRVNSND